ncbi:hypothetical protein DRE_04581 [Drechslerella stenobrocha 248]|uniref:C2H2-type domain-containing protein n=1 Tax=Drechslerella stenobrocha 248 TaxID=1043628 RepID=W7I1T1_9PEZI|nr:hypothetical protein DRE_04581 [Drechslerella stenobrocha 248]
MAVAQYQHAVPPVEENRKEKDRESTAEDHLADAMEDEDEEGSDKEMHDASGPPGQIPASGSPQKRKRRRSRKGMDKKYDCKHPDCGKSYSRAEHLYRHQLNHEPKQIYNCCFPDCSRSFVRQDLCLRHQERHTNRGSQLQRKDMMQHSPVIKQERKNSFYKASSSPDTSGTVMKEEVPSPSFPVKTAISPSTMSGSSSTSAKQADPKPKARRAPIHDTSSNARMRNEQRPPGASVMSPTTSNARRGSIDHPRTADAGPPPIGREGGQFPAINTANSQTPPLPNTNFNRPKLQTNIPAPNLVNLTLQSPYGPQTPHSAAAYLPSPQRQGPHRQNTNENVSSGYNHSTSIHSNYIPQNAFQPFALPPPGFQTMGQNQAGQNFGVTSPPASNNSADHNAGNVSAAASNITQTIVDPTQFSVPVFGGDSYNRSPFMITDDFAAWLFDDATFGFSQAGRSTSIPTSFLDGPNAFFGNLYLGDPAFPQQSLYGTPYHPMSVTSIIAPPSPPQESLLSEHKRLELIDVVSAYPDSSIPNHCSSHFPHMRSLGVGAEKHDDDSVLGLNSMQLYIQLFWQHFHPQLPILHKPTFSAGKTENILLLAIIAIGAACVDRTHFPRLAPAAADLSCILAMNLRWQIFDHADFRPPAKLWIFQALILLETHEKMYSTRELHERAHIHHATTLTLMRRGSSLQGRSALDSPPSIRDEKIGGASSVSGGHSSGTSTPDEWWNHWITNEATKRAAFAAFVLDSVHATMFGHSAVMVAHEMRLVLPCDEALWTATSSAEVGRLKQALYNNGVKPIMFLEGLKRTLTGQTVRTNSFGRTIIMAGLLSVSWHMNQRDLQVNTLGVGQLGTKEKWRGSLTRAFDLWLSDFDKSLQSKIPVSERGSHDDGNYYMPSHDMDVEHDNVFESRTVLHHLAHMAMHVDIVDLQIYAGAKRLLGRSIGGNDSSTASKRMKDWANTARARDAVYYALQFLRQVLLPAAPVMPHEDSSGALTAYVARDDYLLNRPWVLYFATLVVWAYGVALDGPLPAPIHVPQTLQEQHRDMRNYLITVGHRKSPDELSEITDRNRNLGLLLVLQKMFGEMRWELLQEASKLLGQCIEISKGNIPPGKLRA